MDLLQLKILLGDKGAADTVEVPAEVLRDLIAAAEERDELEDEIAMSRRYPDE